MAKLVLQAGGAPFGSGASHGEGGAVLGCKGFVGVLVGVVLSGASGFVAGAAN